MTQKMHRALGALEKQRQTMTQKNELVCLTVNVHRREELQVLLVGRTKVDERHLGGLCRKRLAGHAGVVANKPMDCAQPNTTAPPKGLRVLTTANVGRPFNKGRKLPFHTRFNAVHGRVGVVQMKAPQL